MTSYSIETTTEGKCVVLNHDTQTVDFEGTREECVSYIKNMYNLK